MHDNITRIMIIFNINIVDNIQYDDNIQLLISTNSV